MNQEEAWSQDCVQDPGLPHWWQEPKDFTAFPDTLVRSCIVSRKTGLEPELPHGVPAPQM